MELKKVEHEGVIYQAIEQYGCSGCCFDKIDQPCLRPDEKLSCTEYTAIVGVPIQWVVVDKLKKTDSPLTLEQARQKKKVLEQEVMALLNAFEEETGLRVKGVSTSCAYQVNGTAHTYDLAVEVDFT